MSLYVFLFVRLVWECVYVHIICFPQDVFDGGLELCLCVYCMSVRL